MKRVVLVLTVFLICGWPILGTTQAKSLRDEVREKGYAKHSWEPDLPLRIPHTVDSLIKASDLVICGEVVSHASRLSADEHAVMTDYNIVVSQVLKDPLHLVNTGERITVSEYGGNLTIEGKPVQFDAPYFQPIPPHGSEIFFVMHAPKPNPYWEYGFTFSDIGVWRFKSDKLFCENARKSDTGFARGLCGKPEGDVLSSLQERIAALEGGTK